MNIHQVRDNIKNTIIGKKAYLQALENEFNLYPKGGTAIANYATIEFLRVNIDELSKILKDVETCCHESQTTRIQDSWVGAVDRQGGSFTEEELDPNRGWR